MAPPYTSLIGADTYGSGHIHRMKMAVYAYVRWARM